MFHVFSVICSSHKPMVFISKMRKNVKFCLFVCLFVCLQIMTLIFLDRNQWGTKTLVHSTCNMLIYSFDNSKHSCDMVAERGVANKDCKDIYNRDAERYRCNFHVKKHYSPKAVGKRVGVPTSRYSGSTSCLSFWYCIQAMINPSYS